MGSLTLEFQVSHPGEPGAGIRSYTDTVTVTVDSGEPGGDPGEFKEHMANALREWYDGALVVSDGQAREQP